MNRWAIVIRPLGGLLEMSLSAWDIGMPRWGGHGVPPLQPFHRGADAPIAANRLRASTASGLRG